MSRRKKSKAVPVVIIITLLVIALCVGCFFAKGIVDSQRRSARADLQKRQNEVAARNQQAEAAYAAEIARLESEAAAEASPSWPEHKKEGWDLLDLSNFALENQTAETKTRTELMAGGMLLVNEWHSRPTDFSEEGLVSVGRHLGKERIQVKDYNVLLFPNAANALGEAVDAAKAEGMTHYLVEEGYRSYEVQNTYFNNKVTKLSSKYTGDALIEAAKKEVNAPGTSEYNSGLAFELRLYDKNDPEVGSPKYSTTAEGKWMSENCWKYGIVFRFPEYQWPLETSTDKSFKTGVIKHLNLYRYVGKGNAAAMHYLDLCMEEYIEFLQEHPHIALFENDKLKYEIYRQYVGDASTFDVQLTRNARSWTSSLDNMGAVITVFEY